MSACAETAAPAASVSILLVVKNGKPYLEQSLPLLCNQDYDGAVEFVCIDSGSTDGTVELLEAQGITVETIPPAQFHHGRTRNLAASKAKYDVLVCLSQDALPVSEDWLKSLVVPFADDRVGAVYGKQTAPDWMGARRRQGLCSEYPDVRRVRDPEQIGQYNPGHFRFSNANAAIRRTCWEQYRWDESVLLAEDQGMCRDLLLGGWVVIYEPAAEVVHGHERSLWGEFTYAFENGVSLSRLGILNNPAVGGELAYGLRRMATDMMYFARRGRVDCMATSTISFVLRYLGVQLGKREGRLPDWLLRRVSQTYQRQTLQG